MDKYLLIPLLPLVAFTINIIFGRGIIKDKAHLIAIPAVAVSFVISLATFIEVMGGKTVDYDIYTWITSGDLKVSVGFLIDQLTAIMLIVVTSVSLLVHIYSVGYMHGDKGYYRYFSYLSLFTFSMLILVMGNNLLMMYFGWEAVGLCSYLLIGFWFKKKTASDAGQKAFIVNRIGDFGFAIGLILIFLKLGTFHFTGIFAEAGALQGQTINILGYEIGIITLIALLLFCGAIGKSAQIPLHVWLPDAMEGPTPVSALIHAATMVTAGVYMVARFNPIFSMSETAMLTVAMIGAMTCLLAATIALVQNDIKRIIAYSTLSHLGFMFLACGVGAYTAGIFHLYTHAFFKALLFLGAGSVMHAMAGEVNIQKMGGLKKHMPVTYLTFLIASLSIAGIPGLAGFFSKDKILWYAYNAGTTGQIVWIMGTLAAVMTAFYSFRIIFLVFHGKFRGTPEQAHHLHESPKVMTIPLIILAVGAMSAGWIGIPEMLGGNFWIGSFLKPVLGYPLVVAEVWEAWMVMFIAIAAAISGIFLAKTFYISKQDIPEKLTAKFKNVYTVLWNKYYADELYDRTIVKPTHWTANNILLKITDGKIIEGAVSGISQAIMGIGAKIRRLQSGHLQHYAMGMAIGLFMILAVILIATK